MWGLSPSGPVAEELSCWPRGRCSMADKVRGRDQTLPVRASAHRRLWKCEISSDRYFHTRTPGAVLNILNVSVLMLEAQ